MAAFDKISTTHHEKDAEAQPSCHEASNYAEKEIYQDDGAILVALDANSKDKEIGNLKTTDSGHVCIPFITRKLSVYMLTET